MKLVTYQTKREPLMVQGEQYKGERIGWVEGKHVVDIGLAQAWTIYHKKTSDYIQLPTEMIAFLEMGKQGMELLQSIASALQDEDLSSLNIEGEPVGISLEEAKLLAPVPVPRNFRDFYAFEQHVKNSTGEGALRWSRSCTIYQCFTSPIPIPLSGTKISATPPSETKELDYELEICCIIGRKGKNIDVADAASHIAGFCILNDWSARDLQRKEMRVGSVRPKERTLLHRSGLT